MSKKTQDNPFENKGKWEKFADEQEQPSPEQDIAEEEALDDAEVDPNTELEFPSRTKLEDKLTAIEQKVDEYKDQNLRLKAEIKNLVERSERNVEKAHRFGAEKLLGDLLPVDDSLIRGLEGAPSDDPQVESLREGMRLTSELLRKTLVKHGVEVINPQPGEAFNPELHEAMSMQPDPNAEPNTVLQVLQQGFSLNGRVLRAAMVIVAS